MSHLLYFTFITVNMNIVGATGKGNNREAICTKAAILLKNRKTDMSVRQLADKHSLTSSVDAERGNEVIRSSHRTQTTNNTVPHIASYHALYRKWGTIR